MASKAELALILSLVDDVSKTAKGVKGNLLDLGQASGGVQGALVGLGKIGFGAVVGGAALAGTALMAVGAAAFKSAMAIDDAMDTIAIGTGATGDRLDELNTVMTDVLSNTSAGVDVVAGALTALDAKIDTSDEDLYNLTLGITELSRMTGGDASKNAELFARTLGDWAVPAEEGNALLDKMFVATQNSGIGFERLNELVVQFGAPLRNMGFTLDDSLALLSKWEKEGVNVETVMGGMRIAAGKFAKSGKPLRESLLETFDSIQENTDASAALSLGMEVFGARAGPDMTAAIREGRFAIDDMVAMMGDAQGAIESTSRATEDWPEKLARAKNKITVALAPIGDAFLGVAGKVLDRFMPALDGLGSWLEENVVPGFDKVGGAVDTFFADLDAGRGAVEGLKDVLWTLLPPGMAADLTGAIGWVQDLVTNIQAGDWSAAGASIWETIVGGFGKAGDWAGDVLDNLRTSLGEALGLEPLISPELLRQGIMMDDVSWGDIGKEIAHRILAGLVDISGAIAGFTGKLRADAESEEGMADAQATGRAMGEWVVEAIRNLFSSDEVGQTLIGALIDNMKRAALNLHDASAANGAAIAAGMYAGMTAEIESQEQIDALSAVWKRSISRANPIDALIEEFRDVGPAIEAIRGGNMEPLYNPWWQRPEGNAAGTDWWRGGPTWVGERGPEIVDVPRGAAIHSNAESGKLAGGATYNVTQNFYGPTNARDVEIGVLNGLRALGVAVGV